MTHRPSATNEYSDRSVAQRTRNLAALSLSALMCVSTLGACGLEPLPASDLETNVDDSEYGKTASSREEDDSTEKNTTGSTSDTNNTDNGGTTGGGNNKPQDEQDTSKQDNGKDTTDPKPEGPPPQTQSFSAVNESHFELLADNSEYTNFSVEKSGAVQVKPLEPKNFPDGYSWKSASGKDKELNEKQQFARAKLKGKLKTWYYDVTITTLPEEDGECPYQLVLNDKIVKEYTNPKTGGGIKDRVPYDHTWKKVMIRDGDVVEIRSRAHSNLKMKEGAAGRSFSPTYAWARARWKGVKFAPSK